MRLPSALIDPLSLSDALYGSADLIDHFARRDCADDAELRAEVDALVQKMNDIRQRLDDQPLAPVDPAGVPKRIEPQTVKAPTVPSSPTRR